MSESRTPSTNQDLVMERGEVVARGCGADMTADGVRTRVSTCRTTGACRARAKVDSAGFEPEESPCHP